jgi:Tol biopolymer transport system component
MLISKAALALSGVLVALATGTAKATSQPLIAFSAEVAGNSDIYVAHIDGSGLRRVTTRLGDDFDPSFSPDRSHVAYRCQVGTSSDICIAPVDGGEIADITKWTGDEWSPAWSPDGQWIAFYADHTDLGSLWLIRPDGTGAHRLVGGGEYPSWSPNGRWLAYADMRTRDIAVIRADGTGRRLLARSAAYDGRPSFSRNGRSIAFDSQRGFRHVQEPGIGPEFEIYVVSPSGRHLTRITHNHAEDRFPDFGPNGYLVYSEGGQLWIAKAHGCRISRARHGCHARRLPLHGSFPDW